MKLYFFDSCLKFYENFGDSDPETLQKRKISLNRGVDQTTAGRWVNKGPTTAKQWGGENRKANQRPYARHLDRAL